MIKITIKQYLLSREFIFKLSLDDNRRKVMEKLLENKLLKHYLIISYLLPRKWEKIRDIAKTTGLSEITIRQNISEINQYILPAKINSSQQRGIRLFLPPQQNGFFIFRNCINNHCVLHYWKKSLSIIILISPHWLTSFF